MPASGATVPRGTIGMRFSLAKGLFHVERDEVLRRKRVLTPLYGSDWRFITRLSLAVKEKSHFLIDLGSVRKLLRLLFIRLVTDRNDGFTPEIPQP